MDQKLAAYLSAQFNEISRHFDAVHQRFEVIDRKIESKFDEAKRAFGVIAEGLREEIRAVADGHLVLARQSGEFREENEAAHREIIGMLKSSYGALDTRLTRLESRRRRGGPGR